MELNREQIVKALEVCTTEEDCVGCPYLIRRGDGSILPCSIDADALALIRELTIELDAMRCAANSYKMDNQRLTEENERLEKEVDRLSQVVLYHDGITEMNVAEAKADTVRKMREELVAEPLPFFVYEGERLVTCKRINDVAEKLLREVK